MPDQKISDLGDGGLPLPTDDFVVARGATNNKLAWSSMSAAVHSSLSGTGAVSIATNGSTISIGVPAQTVQTQNAVDVTLSGNTAGALALVSSGTLTLAGGNNITLSQAGNAVTISGANAGGAQTGISGLANSQTTYSSGTVSLSELGGLTIRSSTGQIFQFEVPSASSLSATGIVSISTNGNTISIGASQSVQPETQTFVAGISASDALYTSGTVRFTGSQAATVRSGTGQLVIIDVPAQSVQPETQTFIGGISASDTLYTSGTVRFTGVGGGVTVSSNTGQRVDISVAAQSVQPETQTFIGGISASNTLYTSGSVRFTGSQAVTVRSGTGQLVVIDAPAQSVQAETQTFVAGIQNSQTTYTSGTVNLSVVAGNLTIRSTTGQAFQFSMSQTVQAETQTAISGIANSQTTYTSGTVSLSELGAITIRSTTGNQYQFSVNSQTNQAGSNYAIGNTFGTSSGTHDARTLSIAGDGIISVAASNSGWRISASQSVQAETQTFVGGIGNSQTTYTSGTVNLSVVAGQLTIRSTTGNAFQFSASQSVQAETQTAVSGIANSQTTYTSGTVSLSELGAITIRSTTGNQFQFSVNSQTVQTQNVHNVTLSGNSTSAGAGYIQISSGTLTLAGGNNITLSQNGNAVTISAAAGAETQVAISGIANSQTTYTSGTVSLSELGAITIRSTTGNQFQLSVNAQSVQPETQTFIAGISASDTLYTSGNVRFTGVGGGVTVSSNTGQRVDISVAAQSVQPETQTFVGGIGNSQTTYTSGTVNLSVVAGQLTIRSTTGNAFQFSASQSVQAETQTAISGIANSQTTYTSGTVSLSELGAITIRSTTGNQFQLSVNAQTVQTQTHNVTLAGNSTSAGAGYIQISTGTMTLAGGNNVTLSQNGNAVTISAGGGAETQTAVSGIANSQTTYTSGTVSLSELGAITIRSTTGNQFQFSVNSQSVQVETQTFIGGIRNSETTYTSGTVNLSVVGGALTIRSTTGNAFQFSASQSVQAETQTAISGIANSQTTYTSGTVSWSELGAVTVRSTTGNQFQISVNSQTAQTQSNIQALYDGANSISTGTIRVTDANGVTFSVNGQTLSASVNQSISMFAVSNTTQSSSGTAHKSALSFAGAGVASVGVTGGSVVISVPSGGGVGFSAGVSTGGNTAGATGISGTQLVLVGTNMVSLSQTTGANGATVSINATQSVQTQGILSMGVSTGGNTIGNTTVNTGSRMVLVASGAMTASQATAAGASTITLSVPATSSLSATGAVEISTNGSTISIGAPAIKTLADIQNMGQGEAVLMTNLSAISKVPIYFNMNLPGKITLNSFVFKVSQVTASQPNSLTVHLGIYTAVNSTSMALVGSLSETYVVSSASSVSFSGARHYVITGIGTHTALSVLIGGDYNIGMMFSATATNAMNASLMGGSTANGPLGIVLPGVNNLSTGTSQGAQALWGRGSTTVNAMPANVVRSELVNQGQGASMQLHPWIYIRS